LRSKQHGVVSVGPIYHKGNPLGGCSKERGAALTQLGVSFIDKAFGAGMLVDVAHMSDASINRTVCRFSYKLQRGGHALMKRGFAYTHGGVWHDGVTHPLIADGNRNRCLSKDRARQILVTGGFVGLSPCAPFYDDPSVFFDHLLELHAFVPRVGIGTDYGGILDEWRWPQCETVLDLFCFVADGLLKRGLNEQQVAGIIGDNFRRHLGLL
jgi:microsomal dipeptidase-like Zn-dependent dipeptidase